MTSDDIVRELCAIIDARHAGLRIRNRMIKLEAAALRWRLANRPPVHMDAPDEVSAAAE